MKNFNNEKSLLNNSNFTEKNLEKTFYISGLHCHSCKILIENKLLEQAEIEFVNVDLENLTMSFFGKNTEKFTLDFLNNLFKDLNYSFSYKKNSDLEKKEKIKDFLFAIIFLLIFLIIFLSIDNSFLARYSNVNESSSLFMFFILGVVASVSSCVALVGSLILSLTKKWNEKNNDSKNFFQKLKPHFQFHFGRIFSFILGGAILGKIGEFFIFNYSFLAILIIFISFLLIIISFQMLNFSFAKKINFLIPNFFSSFFSKQKKMPFFLGFGTFFIPCGFTLIIQGLALTTGSFWKGMLVTLFFVLGTFPVLFLISLGGTLILNKVRLSNRFNVVAGTLIFLFSLYTINGQLNVLGWWSFSDINNFSLIQKNNNEKVDENLSQKNNQEVQVIKFIAKDFNYIPVGSTILKSDIPTKMIVDNQGRMGCGVKMMAKGLFPGIITLKSGENIIEFVPKKGVYKLTCTMGMVSPVTIKVE